MNRKIDSITLSTKEDKLIIYRIDNTDMVCINDFCFDVKYCDLVINAIKDVCNTKQC